jgi:hypothetical protein
VASRRLEKSIASILEKIPPSRLFKTDETRHRLN